MISDLWKKRIIKSFLIISAIIVIVASVLNFVDKKYSGSNVFGIIWNIYRMYLNIFIVLIL
jgi:hypothetical protein